MLNTEFSTDITVEMLMKLYKNFGITVQVNDGEIKGANLCDKSTEN